MTCQNCGKQIENGSQFCLYCGQKVEVTYKCVSCGSVIHEGDTFCMSCGWKVNMSETAAKAAEEEEKRKEAEIAAAKAAEEERKRKEAEAVAAKAVEEEERKRKEVEIAAAKAAEEKRKRKEAEIAAAKAKKKNPIVWIILGIVIVGGIIAALFMWKENSSENDYTQYEIENEEVLEQSTESDNVLEKDRLNNESEDGSSWLFTGIIDNKYPITGELSYSARYGHYGSYYYDKNGPDNKLYLSSGEIDGKIVFFETKDGGKRTATFYCDEHDKPLTYIKGTFVVEETGKKYPFELNFTETEPSDLEYIMEDEGEYDDTYSSKTIVKDDSWTNDHSKWVDMGVKSDNGQTLLWATSDFSIDENGAPYLTIYGQKGKTFLWGDIWGDENATMIQNPQMNICGNPEYDIVTAHFGAPARLPSYKEIQSLCDNCTERFVSLDVDVPEFFANNIPSWILGQWMRSTNVNGKAISETIKFDGLLASVLLTQGGKNESTYNGFYTFDGSSIYVNGICYTLDFENQTITAPDGERLRHISTESSIGKAYGCLLTSKINGNKLLLAYQPPVAAASNGSVSVSFRPKQEVYYWSGSVYDQDTDIAYLLGVIKGDGWGLMGKERNLRFCIRPVMEN